MKQDLTTVYKGRNYSFAVDPQTSLPSLEFLNGCHFPVLDSFAVVSSETHGLQRLRLSLENPAFCKASKKLFSLESTGDFPVSMKTLYSFEEGSLTIRTTVMNQERKPLRIYDVAALFVPGCGKDFRLSGGTGIWNVFKHGWANSSPSFSFPMEDGEKEFYLRWPLSDLLPGFLRSMTFNGGERCSFSRGKIRSEWVVGLKKKQCEEAFVTGFLGFKRHFSQIRFDVNERSFEAVAQGDGLSLDQGESFETEDLWIGFGGNGTDVLEEWAVRASGGLSRRHFEIPVVLWSSWYSGLYGKVSEDTFISNLEPFRKAWAGDAYFQLDDGYERAIGDWLECNGKFPSGLKSLSEKIKSFGLRPGIWFAPFSVEKRSRIFREHRDWIIKSGRGKPLATGLIPGPGGIPRLTYSLDTTNPEVLEHIKLTAQTLVKWGFELLKVDFLTSAATLGVRMDRKATRAEAYARGMKVVREGAGEAVLMGAIAPVLANAGWVDIQRVGTDVAYGVPSWIKPWQSMANDLMSPGVRNNLIGTFNRYFLDRRFWISDPDAIVWKGLTKDENQTLMTADFLLGGGVIQIGHDFSKSPLDLSSLKELVCFAREEGRIVDFFDEETPGVIQVRASRLGEMYLLIGLFNFGKETVARRIPGGIFCKTREFRDFWDPTESHLNEGQPVQIPPRGCKLLIYSEVRG